MQKDGKIWFTESKSLYLPRFHFHTGIFFNGNEQITNISCMYRFQPVQVGLCHSFNGVTPSIYNCTAVFADQIEVKNDNGTFENRDIGIACNISTYGQIDQVGPMIAFGLEGQNNYIALQDPHAPLWIAPTQFAIIELNRMITTINGVKATLWDRQLFYLSDAAPTRQTYQIFVTVNGFGAFDYGQQNLYNGWRATGDIGGFAFFLVMIQTGVMILLGFCFVNGSSFLKGSSDSGVSRPPRSAASNAQEYAPLDG